MMRHVLAIDIGGTKVAAAIVTDDATIVARQQCSSTSAAADELFDRIAQMALRLMAGRELACVGVGSAGPIGGNGETVSPLNIAMWRDFPLRSRLGEALGLPVFIDLDTKALALAEMTHGSAQRCRNFLAMVVSTGVGGGLVIDGRLLGGNSGNAGHIGHVNVVPDGHGCVCGSRGCLEAEVSGTAITKIFGLSAPQASPEIVEHCGTLVGRAVASTAALLDLNLAVVGGSVALGFGEPFFAAAQRELSARSRISFARDARIVASSLGDRGPLIGAALVATQGLDAAV